MLLAGVKGELISRESFCILFEILDAILSMIFLFITPGTVETGRIHTRAAQRETETKQRI
jgi:hypothetical protein